MIPPGWRLVPIEPVTAQLDRIAHACKQAGFYDRECRSIYRAALEASPPLPEVGDETLERVKSLIAAEFNHLLPAMRQGGLLSEHNTGVIELARAIISVFSDDTGGRG